MDAVKTVAMQNTDLLQILQTHIAMNMECDTGEDRILEIKVRIAEIDAEFKKLLNTLSVDLDANADTEKAISEMMIEKNSLEVELKGFEENGKESDTESKLNEIAHISQIIENQPLRFDNTLIRQILECIVILSKQRIRLVFRDGTEIEQQLE